MAENSGNPGHPILLTKTFQADDYKALGPELALLEGQPLAHQASGNRKWEYAMALRAMKVWRGQARGAVQMNPLVLDVGGLGSPLAVILRFNTGLEVQVVDPLVNTTLESYAERNITKAGIVLCVSVVEHVEEYEDFLKALAKVTAPGGLLFLTTDIWGGAPGDPDLAHWHWMRKRIYTKETWAALTALLQDAALRRGTGFSLLGPQDWEYHGEEIEPGWGYSFASLALVKW